MRNIPTALALTAVTTVLLGGTPATAAPAAADITSVTVALADTGSWGCTYRLTVSGTAKGSVRIDGQGVGGGMTYPGDHVDIHKGGAFTVHVAVGVPNGVTATYSAAMWKLQRGSKPPVLIDREQASNGPQTCPVA